VTRSMSGGNFLTDISLRMPTKRNMKITNTRTDSFSTCVPDVLGYSKEPWREANNSQPSSVAFCNASCYANSFHPSIVLNHDVFIS
jgi:hypothetical protein